MKINFKIVSAALAATTAGLAIALPLTANHTFKNGVEEGTAAGIVEGRKGYVKGYEGGLVALEGYDGRGNDYSCENSTWVFRKDQIKNLKAGNEYDYNTIKEVFPLYAETYKTQAESVCRALGYQP